MTAPFCVPTGTKKVKCEVKPRHNQHDNIWEIRQDDYPSMEQMQEAFNTLTAFREQTKVGGAIIFHDVREFISAVTKQSVRLPIWKIVIPRLEGHTGAIYYVADRKGANLIFRGTYGYYGTGPHESALIEACFESRGLYFEVRDGDDLLMFLEA